MSAAARPTGRTSTQGAPRQQSPAASAPESAPAPAEPPFELVDIDRYAVFDDGLVGYVEVVPPLFICYLGHPYPKAIEVGQVFDFDQAVRRVRDDHRRSAA